jgi:hypothetical protein
MTDREKIALDNIPAIAPRSRLQFEPAQQAHVLLYPEGMINSRKPRRKFCSASMAWRPWDR